LIKAVIFDLDGTLINLPINYGKLEKDFGRILKTKNLRPLAETVANLNDEKRRQVFKVWDEAEKAAFANFTIKEEGMSLYTRFSEQPKALVTLQGKLLVVMVLEKLGLAFNPVLTRESSLDRTRQIEEAIQRLGISCKDVLFVGNTDDDFHAAKKVGCQFLRVGR